MGKFRATVGVLATVIWTFALLPAQLISVALGARLAERIPRLYYVGICRILGVGVGISGSPVRNRPVLYVSNHSSWLDIPVLGSQVEGSFVAKAEVSAWPGIGFLARLQRTAFVERNRHRARTHAQELCERLGNGARLVLFPEGTSTDGSYVLPFKSALFAAVERLPESERPIIQPVTVAYVQVDGARADRRSRPAVAWFGDMEFAPHLWGVFQLASVGVEVTFHEPVQEACMQSRKLLAAHCERVITEEHARLIGSDFIAPPGGEAEFVGEVV